ncbi:PAS domain S-box protein [Dictyobacter arantiisoli]|uniref:histidine kinase n=1 Tax=Dictyobacter arantiisoli TaxID=2014874 RepID=A0A5A5TBR8_9CHLR|nr:PAS domain S-box protein [Dictyobacter arantiisoli]GCF08931.1 hypothetical protein KDI_24950 [Dictyobacter arantiisoli]
MTYTPEPTSQDERSSLSQLRNEVRQTEQRFKATFEQAAVGMAHVAVDGRWLQVNRKLCSIVGYSQQELLTQSFQDITYRDDLDTDLASMQQLLHGNIDTYSMKKRYIRKDNATIWIHLTVSLARDENGAPLYFISVIEDINAQQQLEENLKQQQQAFQTVAENAPDIISRFDPQYRFIYINPSVRRATGREPEEFIGKTHLEAGLPPEHADKWRTYLTQVFATRQSMDAEFPFQGPEGLRLYEARLTPEFDAFGQVVSVLSIARDYTEQKQLEEQRKQLLIREQNARQTAERERKRLYDLFMQVPALIALLHGPEHVFEFANSSYLQLVDNRDLTGKPIREALPELAGQGYYELLDDLYKTGKVLVGNEQKFALDRHHTGTLEDTYLNFIYQPAHNLDGEIDGILVHAVDVTEQVQSRETLKVSQERLQLAQQAGHIGTFEWRVNDDQVLWTPNLEALYGLPAGGFEGTYHKWTELVHPDDLQAVEENLWDSTRGGPAFNIEFRTIWSDGSIHWLLGKANVTDWENGVGTRVVGVNIDITERKEIELQLARTLQQVDFLSEASKLLVASLDYQDILKHVLERAIPALADWCRIDIKSSEAGIEPLSISYPYAVEGTQELQFITDIPVDAGTPSVLETVCRQKHSAIFAHLGKQQLRQIAGTASNYALLRKIKADSALVIPLTIQDMIEGTITFIATADRDPYTDADLNIAQELANRVMMAIERAQIYQNLQELNANLEARVTQRTEELRLLNTDLERSNQELQEFAYVASHDLQEPLRKIQAFGNLLEEEYAEGLGDGKEYLERMRNAASRMRVLIDDLLTFSRVATKTLPFTSSDLNLIVRDVIDDLETRIQETQGRVEVSPLPTIDADSRQMYQVLQNLIGNALKFHRPGVPPVIKVAASLIDTLPEEEEGNAQQQCILTIEDNGIGFDEKYLSKIFTVFQRLHGRNEYEGTGIGLAVVRKIVERHGGQITARSTPGAGATFIITLPAHHLTMKEIEIV